MNFFAILLPALLSIAAKYCAPTPAQAAAERQRLIDTRQPDGTWHPAVLKSGHPTVRRAVRANNKGKRPKDRVRMRDVNLDEQAALMFAHILAIPESQMMQHYALAKASPITDEE